jgi:hypothetical protein
VFYPEGCFQSNGDLMKEETEIVTGHTGNVFQRIPSQKNLWTMIEANHPGSPGPGGRFHRVKRLGTGTDTNLFSHAGGPTTWQERDDFYRWLNTEPVGFTRRQGAAEKGHTS